MSETSLPAKICNSLSQNWWAPRPPSARYVIIEWSLECLLKKAYTIPSSAHHLLLDQFFPFLLLATNLLKTLSRGPPPPPLLLLSVILPIFLFSVPLPLHPVNFPCPFFASSFLFSLHSLLCFSVTPFFPCPFALSFIDVPPIVQFLSRSILFAPLPVPPPHPHYPS